MEAVQAKTMISPEDVAWADSCLTEDFDELDTDWNSMKEALLETLNAQHDASAHEEDKFFEGTKMEICSSKKTGDADDLTETDISVAASSEGEKPNSSDQFTHEKTYDFWSRYSMEDIFLPTYDESMRDLGNLDPDSDLNVPAYQLDQSTEDIFKIWDLNIPPEEDDLLKQLNKALAESSLEPTTSVSDPSKAWEGSSDESLDHLIAGIADLSLSSNSF